MKFYCTTDLLGQRFTLSIEIAESTSTGVYSVVNVKSEVWCVFSASLMNILIAIKRVKSATTNHRAAIGGFYVFRPLLLPKLTVLTTAYCRRCWKSTFLLNCLAALRQYIAYHWSVVCNTPSSEQSISATGRPKDVETTDRCSVVSSRTLYTLNRY